MMYKRAKGLSLGVAVYVPVIKKKGCAAKKQQNAKKKHSKNNGGNKSTAFILRRLPSCCYLPASRGHAPYGPGCGQNGQVYRDIIDNS